jgi:hypothetical protein
MVKFAPLPMHLHSRMTTISAACFGLDTAGKTPTRPSMVHPTRRGTHKSHCVLT